MDKIIISLMSVITVLGGLIAIALLSAIPVWLLWNYCLVTAVTGVNSITLLQSIGITLLCSILFKSSK